MKKSMNRRGLLVVISGPSGAGKGTLRPGILQAFPEMQFCVSATTRSPRAGEVHGVNYYFWSREEFQRQAESGGLLEWAEYVGNCYGTPRGPVEKLLAQGKDVLLEKEMQGASQLRQRFPEAVCIFVLPPSIEELRRRIIHRGTESPEQQRQRMDKALRELESLPSYQYDYVVVNDDLNEALDKIRSIIIAERCRVARQPSDWIERILNNKGVER